MATTISVMLGLMVMSTAEAETLPKRPDYTAKVLASCAKTFAALPITEKGEPIDPVGSEVAHYQGYQKLYFAYDRDCFFGWGDLKERTRAFLGDNVGALFNSDEPVPYCSAFRLADDVMVTAGHCDIGSTSLTMRLFGHPVVALRVGERIKFPYGSAEGVSDLSDFALFHLLDVTIKSRWTSSTFSRKVVSGQAILVVASSKIAPLALKADGPEDLPGWLANVRFSRTPSNQIWLADELKPPIPQGLPSSDCLFHRAPTFAGMSGAPIIAITVPKDAPTKPIFHVIGIHIRNGFLPLDDHSNGCGDHYPFNVGIKLPEHLLEAVDTWLAKKD
ncbi:hypothetical protein HFN62_13880 [Rhizobium leguminosarum]|uniref:hypothetical protein n=1 Tax=Rhizobium leguminosarum TaxID=384 RepID=UPI001C97E37D|nr:hypothetical protein [Rhizobium leguminosarum]MBY5784826.1 hypothetical protein [Rhizobium leguminosarum]